MGNFNSYSTFTPEQTDAPIIDQPFSMTSKAGGAVHSVTITDGAMSSGSSKHAAASASDLSAFSDEDWRVTARDASGFPTNRIAEDTVVSIDGVNARVADFVKAGLLIESEGGYVKPGQQAPQVDAETAQREAAEAARDAAVMTEEVAAAVDSATEPFDQSTLDVGLAHAISAATGEMSVEEVVKGVSQRSGMDPSEAGARVQFVIDAYQAQTDSYLTRNGIDASEVPAFYEWAKSRGNKASLTTAIQRQAYARDMSAWKPLIAAFKRTGN
ncbi:hypothetical protein DF058_15840 [Burkholderia cenocepacia]|nr:hypothetical protein DF058_15840 [Burkholderia cenocepacia]RRA14981.1 hypothetical protein DF059_15975 [Burkholderia cenocepacia]